MTFKDAWEKMLEGRFVRRPGWKGYWFIDCNGRLIMKLASGQYIMQGDFTQTIKNTFENDWEVVDDDEIF
jgi:hypothetical protein